MAELYGTSFTREQVRERVGTLAQIGGITEFTYASGKARGVRAVRVDTGRLCVEFVVDRAVDIAHATLDGVPFCWRTANGIPAPAYYEPQGDEWLRSFFGGWLTTCGLSNFGPPGTDRWGTFGQHGRINNIPAETFNATTRWEGDRCIFELEAVMHEVKVMGEHVTLYRRWQTELGSTTLHLEDRVVNEGSKTSPHMILYHCNAGFPLLSPQTRVHISQSAMTPRDEQARAGLDVWNRGAEPRAGFAEQVFLHTPRACRDGKARALVTNAAFGDGAGLGFEIAFDPTQLPAVITWRNLDCGDYVMAVEPANTPAIQGREYAGKNGELPFLEPGEERRYALDFTALSGQSLHRSIEDVEAAVKPSE